MRERIGYLESSSVALVNESSIFRSYFPSATSSKTSRNSHTRVLKPARRVISRPDDTKDPIAPWCVRGELELEDIFGVIVGRELKSVLEDGWS